MPSKTVKQQRLMAACSTTAGRKAIGKRCPPVKVAKEFRKLGRGAKRRGR